MNERVNDNKDEKKPFDRADPIKRSEIKTHVEIKHKTLFLRVKQFMQRLLNQ